MRGPRVERLEVESGAEEGETDERGRSNDVGGVPRGERDSESVRDTGRSMSEAEEMIDFRRAGGKKPRARRERRAISVGLSLFGNSTQES